jgi:hypothetical protein
MKITNTTTPLRRTLQLLALNAAVALLAAGCATYAEHSYNQDFHQNLPTSPNYTIKDVDDSHFKVEVFQGSPGTEGERAVYVKKAAASVAENEAKRRGWTNWDLNYTEDYNHGWMHIVTAEVTRKNAAEKSPDLAH